MSRQFKQRRESKRGISKGTSQKLAWANIVNKPSFLAVEVVDAYLRMGAFSKGRLFNNFPDWMSVYSNGALIRGGHLFEDFRQYHRK